MARQSRISINQRRPKFQGQTGKTLHYICLSTCCCLFMYWEIERSSGSKTTTSLSIRKNDYKQDLSRSSRNLMYPWALFQTKKTPAHLEAFRAFRTGSLSYTPSKAGATTYQKTQIGYNSELTMLLQKSALEDKQIEIAKCLEDGTSTCIMRNSGFLCAPTDRTTGTSS
jgi:hypothetical protein